MKILLINNNPVVSRLTALSARKEDIEIDEIQEVTELSSGEYDIVFVDADSLSKDVEDVISNNINVQKRVLFYTQEDGEARTSFDLTILKPFLPSEVSAVIRSIEEKAVAEESVSELKEEDHFDILAESKDVSRVELFDLSETSEKGTELDLEKLDLDDDLLGELNKVESIKDEKADNFDAKLEEAFPSQSIDLDDDLFSEGSIKAEDFASQDADDLFKLELDDDLFVDEKSAVKTSLANDDLFDLEKNDEVDFDIDKNIAIISDNVEPVQKEEVKQELLKEESKEESSKEKEEVVVTESKILDVSEIANIKDILEGDVNDDLELSELMTTVAPVTVATKQPEEELETSKKKKEKEEKTSAKGDDADIELDTNLAVQTLASMPIESLRELLAGARININIKFPKAK